MRKIIFIINPNAGKDRIKNIIDIIEYYFIIPTISYEIIYTSYRGHARDITIESIENNVDTVVAIGGDGTVNEIGSALVNTKTKLGIVPMGSGNGLARSLDIPLQVNEAMHKILMDESIYIDCGLINNDKYFLSNFGIGFDAKVAQIFASSRKRGFVSYAQIVMKTLLSYQPQAFSMEADGKVMEEKGFMINIANATQFGYNFKIAATASMQDGLLDVVIIKPFPKLQGIEIVISAFLGKLHQHRKVNQFTTKQITLYTKSNSYQIDGDYFENKETKYNISIVEKALKVII